MPQKQGIQLNKYTPDYVVFDLETTGLNPATDRIVEMALVKLLPDGSRDSWVRRLNPGIPIPAEVLLQYQEALADLLDPLIKDDWWGPCGICTHIFWLQKVKSPQNFVGSTA